MYYNKELINHKLLRWERYLQNYSLPDWKEIPDIGLYMDQVIALLTEYLDFIPSNDPKERPITPTTINNYVRLKVMPPPNRRKYYRIHIAYLVVIFTLKQSVSISAVQQILPNGLPEDEVRGFYHRYVEIVNDVALFFTRQTREAAGDVLTPGGQEDDIAVTHLIIQTILMGGFSGILAEKLLQLHGADPEDVLRREVEKDSREV
ncbi:MAG: hypothetical protein H6Q61_994 [Firmicutes bacterium]|nr:hypothetical protein [Bacillota bacterium]